MFLLMKQSPMKFSIAELRSAKMTLETARKNNLVIDKRRKTCAAEKVKYLLGLGLPQEYSGIVKVEPRKSSPKRSTMTPVKTNPAITPKKETSKPKSEPKPKITPKPEAKPKAKPEIIPTAVKTEASVVKKPSLKVSPPKKPEVKAETVVEKPAPKVEKTVFEKTPSSAIDPKIQTALTQIFSQTPLFGKKSDLIEALDKHMAVFTDLTSDQLLDKLKDENIIKYSRTSPRGYSLN